MTADTPWLSLPRAALRPLSGLRSFLRASSPEEGTMNQEQETELQRYKDLMRQAEDRKDEAGITNLRREIDRLLHTPDETPKDDPDKP